MKLFDLNIIFPILAILFMYSCEEEFFEGSSHISQQHSLDKSIVYEGGKVGEFKKVTENIEWNSIEKLIVTGHINANDLYVIRNSINPKRSTVKELDFRDAEILEGTFPRGIFSSNKQLERFIYPHKMMFTGDFILSDCFYLKEIVIPEEVEIMGMSVFEAVGEPGWDNDPHVIIERIPMPKEMYEVPSMVKRLGIECYAYYPFKSIELPDGVERIDGACFSRSKLETFTFPPKVTSIENSLFRDAFNLKEVKLHNKITVIKDKAFSGCKALDELIMPESITKVGSYFLAGTENLKKVVWSPNITSLPESSLANLELEEFHVPENITSLGRSCFLEAKTKRVYFHENIKELGDGLFNYNAKSNSNFQQYMEELHVKWMTPPEVGNTFETLINFGMGKPEIIPAYDFSKITLYVPVGTKEKYANAKGWKKFGEIIEE